MFTTAYGEEVKVDDWVVWARGKGSLGYGQVIHVSPHTVRVLDWSIRHKDFLPTTSIIKTKAVVRAIPMTFKS